MYHTTGVKVVEALDNIAQLTIGLRVDLLRQTSH